MRGKQKSSPRKYALRILSPLFLLAFFCCPLFSWGFQSKDGQSVASGNTESASVQTNHPSFDDEEVTPETWRTINLEMRKADGSVAKIDLLRPLWWLEEAGAEVGGTIPLSMQEMGIEGDAKVLNIGPCKADSRTGDPRYRVVTGKFTHENAIVLDLYSNNSPNKLLGVTPNHPLWSETRNGWVEAGQLKIGEYVKTKDGIAQLTQRSQRPGRHRVYNLEVHKDHTYYVSNLGILAHNSCLKAESPVWKEAKPYKGKTKTNGLSRNKKEYYEWDHTHGDIEVYDSKGVHLGSKDPVTGEMYKPPVKGRKIKL